MINETELIRKMLLFSRKARAGIAGGGPAAAKDPCKKAHELGRKLQQTTLSEPLLSREHLLMIIQEFPQGIRQKAVAEKAGVNQSSASELISKLAEAGYIRREPDPDDKRATLIFLTEKGKERAMQVQEERKNLYGGIFDALSEKEKQTLSDLLDKLLKKQA